MNIAVQHHLYPLFKGFYILKKCKGQPTKIIKIKNNFLIASIKWMQNFSSFLEVVFDYRCHAVQFLFFFQAQDKLFSMLKSEHILRV